MRFSLQTKGHNDIIDITDRVRDTILESGVTDGIAVVFSPGSTCGITTIEYEPGLIADLKKALERLAPMDGEYAHNERWGDGNGYAHVRSAFLKPSLAIPVENGELTLGEWQQIVFIDFDNRQRRREVIVQVAKNPET